MKRREPGQIRIKLAERLAISVGELIKLPVRFSPYSLWPVAGYWAKQDVYRWEGQFEFYEHGKWQRAAINSWSTMTECLRGFELVRESWCEFEVCPLEKPKRKRKKPVDKA